MTTRMTKKLILVTSGDVGGIGPDICLDIAKYSFHHDYQVLVIGDSKLLQKRAQLIGHCAIIHEVDANCLNLSDAKNVLNVLNIQSSNPDIIGYGNSINAAYVLETLDTAINWCKNKLSNIIVTAPVSKEVISQSGVHFSGHTEYFAEKFGCNKVVMMLANQYMKVALLTTHLPLKDVVKNVTTDNLNECIAIIMDSLQHKYGIKKPRVAVCGLNPHAGEGGYMGDEEINVINPVIKAWQSRGYDLSGSYPADTVFLQASNYDLILAMYHDQGLPVLKYSGFESGINVTLGLPIIRTSVDHGTAFNLAGSGRASSESLIHAIKFAIKCDMGIV